ncbi:trypsin-like peptidase domain-containing protein [Virgibacillus sp. C22-A2]|uniref:Trypsin-like peptidase domain-containing protein n=1 Tax=Virgibacillus tibetensis TaxID=3042313 RepID=A0ABU6KJT8_9BACI|nr:trypsin-like peptidase domain-containing protein [Virgibacillus sp. C22-A2]
MENNENKYGDTQNRSEENNSIPLEESIHSNSTKIKKNYKSKSGLHILLAGIVGGVISASIIVLLMTANILPLQHSSNTSASTQENTTPDMVRTLASDNAELASNIAEVSEAVVGVINLQQQSVWTQSEEQGSGSGIIYKKENNKAYVVTNQHVVDGAKEVEIALNNDERIQATVLGTDPLTDLAVLEVDGDKINTVATMGSSEDLLVGETVAAIGNPLGLDFANTVTKGIISGLNRSISVDTNGDRQPDWITEVIQTDAAINPGNSGGALVNSKGEVIGINSMKVAQQEVEGIGFAIPVNAALPIMEQLETNGEIERPLIGISTAPINQVPPQYRNEINLPDDLAGGMVVAEVQAGSAAEKAGLQQFDVITKINDNEITSILELRKFLYSETNIGDDIQLEFYRNGEPEKVSLELQKQD